MSAKRVVRGGRMEEARGASPQTSGKRTCSQFPSSAAEPHTYMHPGQGTLSAFPQLRAPVHRRLCFALGAKQGKSMHVCYPKQHFQTEWHINAE